MPWQNDTFIYTKKLLKSIAENYNTIYEGLPIRGGQITNPWALAEYRADFDIALDGIGRGRWHGVNGNRFKDYSRFGRLQQIIISDIMGIPDYELLRLGFYDIPRLRGYAYYLLARYLNG